MGLKTIVGFVKELLRVKKVDSLEFLIICTSSEPFGQIDLKNRYSKMYIVSSFGSFGL